MHSVKPKQSTNSSTLLRNIATSCSILRVNTISQRGSGTTPSQRPPPPMDDIISYIPIDYFETFIDIKIIHSNDREGGNWGWKRTNIERTEKINCSIFKCNFQNNICSSVTMEIVVLQYYSNGFIERDTDCERL